MSKLTREQLLRFIAIRNRSEFQSNLQFGFDASEAGFDVRDLGDPVKVGPPGRTSYHWETPFGTLIELPGGKLLLRAATGEQVYPGVIEVPFLEGGIPSAED